MKIVKIETLLNFIKSKVPNLTDPEIINSATGYHYTMHSGCIEQMGKFLGRSIDGDMDRSQHSLESVKATDENGVVSAYPDLAHTIAEGKYNDCHIYEIKFSEAIAAYHQQEVQLAKSIGIDVPKTLFIPAQCISSFKLLGRASEIKKTSEKNGINVE